MPPKAANNVSRGQGGKVVNTEQSKVIPVIQKRGRPPKAASKVPNDLSDLQRFKNDYAKLTGQQNTNNENVLNNLKRVLKEKYGFKINGNTKKYKTILEHMQEQLPNNMKIENKNINTISGIINTLKNQGIIKTNNRVGIPINIFFKNSNIKNNRIINYIIKRKISGIESIENLKKTIKSLNNILKDKKYRLLKLRQLQTYIEINYSKYPKALLPLTTSYIYSIREYIKNNTYNIYEKIFYILNHINIKDLGNYNECLTGVKKPNKDLLFCTIDFIINRLKNSRINRPILQHVLEKKIKRKQSYSQIREGTMNNNTKQTLTNEKQYQSKTKNKIQQEINGATKTINNLDKFYNKVNRHNVRTMSKALYLNVNASEFYLMMAKDMIHDTDDKKFKEQLYVDNFIKIFSDIINNVLPVNYKDKVKFKKANTEVIKDITTKLDNIISKTNVSVYNNNGKVIKEEYISTYSKSANETKIKEELLKILDDKIKLGDGDKVPITPSGITNSNSKNLVTYKFKGNRTKYYKKFDILINANTQNKSSGGNITTFLHDLYKPSQNPIMSKIITLSQIANKGMDFIVSPVELFHNFMGTRKNQIQKKYKIDEKRINVFINLMDNNNKKFGSFRISNEFDMKSKKFYVAINGKRIDIKSKGDAGKSHINKLGKFLGDFGMILKVIYENKINKDKSTAFGTFDKNGALIFIKLAKIAKIKPRLFFVEHTPRFLYIIGMNDIISRRVTETSSKNRILRNRTLATESLSKYAPGSVNKSIPSTLDRVKQQRVNNRKVQINNLLKKTQNNFQNSLNEKTRAPKVNYNKMPPRPPYKIKKKLTNYYKLKRKGKQQKAKHRKGFPHPPKQRKEQQKKLTSYYNLTRKVEPPKPPSKTPTKPNNLRNNASLNNKVKPPKAPDPKITLSKPPNKPINLRNNDPTSVLSNFNSSSNPNTSSKRSALPKKSPPGSKRQKLQMNNT